MAIEYDPKKRDYQQSDAVTKAQQDLQQYQQNRPGEYQSKWQHTMDDLISKYQSRGPFRYDINADAMYQQMVDRYVQQGQQAMMDTIGQAASLTGGYGNSYAQTAGQQTYQGYLQGANDMLPQFYQMALDRYNSEGDALLQQYRLLSDQEDTAYGRYVDQLNQYFTELDRLQNAYDNERSFDYGQFADDRNYQYQVNSDKQKLAQAQVDYLISIGGAVSDELLAAAGYDPSYLASINAVRASKASSGGGGGGRRAKKEDAGGDELTYSDVRQTAWELRQKGASLKEIYQYIDDTVNSGNYKPTADISQDMKDLKNNYMRKSGR